MRKMLVLLFASAFLAVLPSSAWCDEEAVVAEPTVASTADSKYVRNKIEENTAPLSERSYGVDFLGRRVTSSLKVEDLIGRPVGDNVYMIGALLADLATVVETVCEQMETGTNVVNPSIVAAVQKNCLAAIARIEETYGRIADSSLSVSPKYASVSTELGKTQEELKTAKAELAGLHQDLYGTFAPVTIKVKYNPVQQRVEEATYPDNSPLDFVAVVVPGRFGGSIVSLQKDIKSGLYAPMSCNNVSGYPLDADGYRTLTLTVGAERYASPEEALKGLCDTYRVDPTRAPALIRNGV